MWSAEEGGNNDRSDVEVIVQVVIEILEGGPLRIYLNSRAQVQIAGFSLRCNVDTHINVTRKTAKITPDGQTDKETEKACKKAQV